MIFLNRNSVSFSGVDGAGKTTVLRHIKTYLSASGFKTIELRSRPSVLPILSAFRYGKSEAELVAGSRLPRQGKNTSVLGSYLRFFYYLFDYIFGQIYIYFRYTKRGYFVIYDRFFYDYIVDPKRANILINDSFVRFFLGFVSEPRLNVFLYAPPDVISARKKELDFDTILMLNERYMALFSDLAASSRCTYVTIENLELTVTLGEIESRLERAFT